MEFWPGLIVSFVLLLVVLLATLIPEETAGLVLGLICLLGALVVLISLKLPRTSI